MQRAKDKYQMIIEYDNKKNEEILNFDITDQPIYLSDTDSDQNNNSYDYDYQFQNSFTDSNSDSDYEPLDFYTEIEDKDQNPNNKALVNKENKIRVICKKEEVYQIIKQNIKSQNEYLEGFNSDFKIDINICYKNHKIQFNLENIKLNPNILILLSSLFNIKTTKPKTQSKRNKLQKRIKLIKNISNKKKKQEINPTNNLIIKATVAALTTTLILIIYKKLYKKDKKEEKIDINTINKDIQK